MVRGTKGNQYMKYLSLLVFVLIGTSFAQGKMTSAAGSAYEKVLNSVDIWDLQRNYAPVYYGRVYKNNEDTMKAIHPKFGTYAGDYGQFHACLALAFVQNPKDGVIHYVHKMYQPYRGDCKYGSQTTGLTINKPACLPDPSGAKAMTPNLIGYAAIPGNYGSRTLDFNLSNGWRVGRAGLMARCTYKDAKKKIDMDKSLSSAKGSNYYSGKLGTSVLSAIVSNQYNRFEMRGSNGLIYSVELSSKTNTADPNHVAPKGILAPVIPEGVYKP